VITNVVSEVQEQLHQHLEKGQDGVKHRPVDVEEERRVQLFTTTGCGCRLADNAPCSSQFSPEHYTRVRGNAAELSWSELNMTIMSQVMALTQCDSQLLNYSKHRHSLKEREKTFTTFYHKGHQICKKTLLFLHGVEKFRLKAIKASYLAHGLVTRVHGHTGRISPYALVLQDIQNILNDRPVLGQSAEQLSHCPQYKSK